MLLKKIYWLTVFSLACNSQEAPIKPVEKPDSDEPKQYGTPFTGVVDPKRVILYEVNIRAFSEAGDFQGVIDKLDHIKGLGINTIWLMPIHPVGKEKSAGGLGSPYAVKNYLEVNPEFGDLAKFRELVQAAHDRSMAVIIDWVANHTAWDNPWMENKSWYTQDTNGNIIIPPGTNWLDVAELNYNNSDMRKAMIHAMKYWILEANVDGFRCDAVDFVPTDFWTQAINELKVIKDRKLILLAEGGKPENFDAGFQMNYAWDFCTTLDKVYSENKSASMIFATHASEYQQIPAGAVKLRYTTNHDLSAWEATPIEVFGSEEAALSASVITIFTSAAPLLYSSQEVGREAKLPFFTREPIEWSANAEMLSAYQKLFGIYNESTAFIDGELQVFDNANVAAFKRTKGEEQYVVFVNVRNTQQSMTIDPSLEGTVWTNKITSETITLSGTLNIPPYGYYVLGK